MTDLPGIDGVGIVWWHGSTCGFGVGFVGGDRLWLVALRTICVRTYRELAAVWRTPACQSLPK